MTEPRAGTFSRLPSLTGMRFLAAFLVFTCHSSVLGYFTAGTATHLVRYAYPAGWTGVEFFFVLSGFVLTWSVREGEPELLFWRRRLVKIYPNYLVVWLAAIGLAYWASYAVDWPSVLPSLFLMHTWSDNIQVIVSNNAVTWSLACEMVFYLLFPFLYRQLKRIPDNRLWWSVGAVTAVVVVLPAIATLLPNTPGMPNEHMSLPQEWFLVWFPPTQCVVFILGMLLARIVRVNRWIGLGIVPALVIAAVGVVLQQLVFANVYSLEAPMALPLALLIAAVAVADMSGQRSPFRARWLVWLGGISYAFYLVHFLVLEYAHIPLGSARTWPVPAALGILACLLVVTIVVAWLLTRLVEEPAMRNWARPRPRPSVPEAPVVTTHAPLRAQPVVVQES